jgi:hypothetical protein
MFLFLTEMKLNEILISFHYFNYMWQIVITERENLKSQLLKLNDFKNIHRNKILDMLLP